MMQAGNKLVEESINVSVNESMDHDPDSSKEILTRHMASTRFEAARQIASMGQNNKFTRLHGHGFMVSAVVSPGVPVPGSGPQVSSLNWPPYAGGDVPALMAALGQHSELLNYRSLNDVVAEPSDLKLAGWFGERLQTQVPGLVGVALQSTPDQGVAVAMMSDSLVWRRYRFQAAHHLPHVQLGHKCGRLHGHGFEVVLSAISNGLVDYDALDGAWAQLASLLNYSCLNDIAGLENPTSEMLSSWIWQKLKPVVPSLTAVSVYETASCGATFDGHNYCIWKDFTIDSAVRYRHATDSRRHVHGYTYTLRLHLSAPLDQVMGWTVDFGDVKEVFTPVFKSLDHHPLHQNPELLAVSNGDTGSMAKWLFGKARGLLPSLVRVDLFETEGCGSSVGTDLRGPVLPLVRG